MSCTFDWTIVELERFTKDGIVYIVHYTLIARSGDYVASSYGSVKLEPPAPGNLIPYDQLTADVVVGWVKGHLGPEKVEAMESALSLQLLEQHSPSTAVGLPWNLQQHVAEEEAPLVEPEVIAEPVVDELNTHDEEEEEESYYSGETVLIRARNELGQYIADDGTTEGHNEAWIEVPIEDA